MDANGWTSSREHCDACPPIPPPPMNPIDHYHAAEKILTAVAVAADEQKVLVADSVKVLLMWAQAHATLSLYPDSYPPAPPEET